MARVARGRTLKNGCHRGSPQTGQVGDTCGGFRCHRDTLPSSSPVVCWYRPRLGFLKGPPRAQLLVLASSPFPSHDFSLWGTRVGGREGFCCKTGGQGQGVAGQRVLRSRVSSLAVHVESEQIQILGHLSCVPQCRLTAPPVCPHRGRGPGVQRAPVCRSMLFSSLPPPAWQTKVTLWFVRREVPA